MTTEIEPREPHKLFMSESRIVDGGVVVMRYRAFCRCHWAQDRQTRSERVALAAYKSHIATAEREA